MERRGPSWRISTGQLARDWHLNSFQDHLASRAAASNSEKSSAGQKTCTTAPAATNLRPGHPRPPACHPQGVCLGGRGPHRTCGLRGSRGAGGSSVLGGLGHPLSLPGERSPRLPGEGGSVRRSRCWRPRRSPSLCAAAARRLRTGPRARGGTRLCVCAYVCECVSMRE